MIKKKLPWRIWAVFLIAAMILAGLYYYGVFARQKKAAPVYSVILYQNTLDEWNTMIEGMKQAEKDLDVDVNYVYLAKEDTAQVQADAIRRELRNGSAGVLMAAVDSRGIQDAFANMILPVPVICVETGAGNVFPVIRSDDRAMGRMLGEEILKDMENTGNERRVTILKEYMERDSVRLRYEGLTEALRSADKEVVIAEKSRQTDEYSLEKFLENGFYDAEPYLVTLDKYTTEQAAAVWTGNRQQYDKNGISCKIYGIGNTSQTVNDLDNGNIEALVYQNEFNMGYQALVCMVGQHKKVRIEENVNIGFGLVTEETLYEDENQRLLFSNN